MAVAVSPPGYLGTVTVSGGGGDQRLSVGTLGHGNGGSFVSGLSGLAAATEEEDEAVFGKILQVVSCSASAVCFVRLFSLSPRLPFSPWLWCLCLRSFKEVWSM